MWRPGGTDHKVLGLIRESLTHLEINGPNAIIGLLPDGRMNTCCDSKKLRPVVLEGDNAMVAVALEACGGCGRHEKICPNAAIRPARNADERFFLLARPHGPIKRNGRRRPAARRKPSARIKAARACRLHTAYFTKCHSKELPAPQVDFTRCICAGVRPCGVWSMRSHMKMS